MAGYQPRKKKRKSRGKGKARRLAEAEGISIGEAVTLIEIYEGRNLDTDINFPKLEMLYLILKDGVWKVTVKGRLAIEGVI